MDGCSFERAARAVQQGTGVVIPVYLPPGVDRDLGRELLEDTVRAYAQQMENPAAICLSVDGEECGREVAEDLAGKYQVQACCSPENKGKLHAVRHGMARLWENPDLGYLSVVDADGDHFANELVNLVRAALSARSRGVEEVLVLGRRISRHRPLGFLRGELEELADRVLLDALAYDAAVRGRPLQWEWATTLEEFPDFHSGFKLFSRGAAQAAFLEEPRQCGVSEEAYFKHGCEAVMTLEALQSGAILVLVNRSTFNEQPISTFGLLDRERMVADKIIWPCKRLGVPAPFVDQWLCNHMPRLLLTTLAPQGKEELQQIRKLILEEFEVAVEADERMMWGPLFV